MYQLLETSSDKTFLRNDVSTWDNWPTGGMTKHGMISKAPVFTTAALQNRQNQKLHKLFSLLLGTDNILVNNDRYGFFRPTKQVPIGTNVVDKPQWKTSSNLHMDMDPWGFVNKAENKSEQVLSSLEYGDAHLNHFIFENNQISYDRHNGIHLQGVINILENFEDDGGFHMVPGFKHYFEEWLKLNNNKDIISLSRQRNSYIFDEKDPIQNFSIRIPMRAGSLVVWDQRSPHGARANNSSRLRCAQFVKMSPAEPMDQKRSLARASTLLSMIKSAGFNSLLTDVGRQVFGLSTLNRQKKPLVGAVDSEGAFSSKKQNGK